jgi:hypothetical protein
MQQPVAQGLAASGAAEEGDLHREKPGPRGQLGRESPAQPRPIEEDGLLRQPGEPAAGLDRQSCFDHRVAAVRAIDLLGRLTGQGDGGIGADPGGELEPIAAGDATAGIDQHTLQRLARLEAGKEHAQRSVLIKMGEGSAPGTPREDRLDAPVGPLRGSVGFGRSGERRRRIPEG